MNDDDLARLQQLAQGDGEMRLSKRLMRGLLAQMKLNDTAERVQAMVGRTLRTQP